MGNYSRTINDALAKRDYITALEQCVASAKSLNLHDSAVMDNFMANFTRNSGTSCKAIELPDGRVVHPKDAIKWLEEQEAAANAEAESGAIPVASEEDAERVTAAADAAQAETGEVIPF